MPVKGIPRLKEALRPEKAILRPAMTTGGRSEDWYNLEGPVEPRGRHPWVFKSTDVEPWDNVGHYTYWQNLLLLKKEEFKTLSMQLLAAVF